ncbi:hypothetical protein JL721_4490 [Aureococcus anophagefferens]|nr:hypothetical protein JL721_4490 [Aureococcus anophagefferens]
MARSKSCRGPLTRAARSGIDAYDRKLRNNRERISRILNGADELAAQLYREKEAERNSLFRERQKEKKVEKAQLALDAARRGGGDAEIAKKAHEKALICFKAFCETRAAKAAACAAAHLAAARRGLHREPGPPPHAPLRYAADALRKAPAAEVADKGGDDAWREAWLRGARHGRRGRCAPLPLAATTLDACRGARGRDRAAGGDEAWRKAWRAAALLARAATLRATRQRRDRAGRRRRLVRGLASARLQPQRRRRPERARAAEPRAAARAARDGTLLGRWNSRAGERATPGRRAAADAAAAFSGLESDERAAVEEAAEEAIASGQSGSTEPRKLGGAPRQRRWRRRGRGGGRGGRRRGLQRADGRRAGRRREGRHEAVAEGAATATFDVAFDAAEGDERRLELASAIGAPRFSCGARKRSKEEDEELTHGKEPRPRPRRRRGLRRPPDRDRRSPAGGEAYASTAAAKAALDEAFEEGKRRLVAWCEENPHAAFAVAVTPLGNEAAEATLIGERATTKRYVGTADNVPLVAIPLVTSDKAWEASALEARLIWYAAWKYGDRILNTLIGAGLFSQDNAPDPLAEEPGAAASKTPRPLPAYDAAADRTVVLVRGPDEYHVLRTHDGFLSTAWSINADTGVSHSMDEPHATRVKARIALDEAKDAKMNQKHRPWTLAPPGTPCPGRPGRRARDGAPRLGQLRPPEFASAEAPPFDVRVLDARQHHGRGPAARRGRHRRGPDSSSGWVPARVLSVNANGSYDVIFEAQPERQYAYSRGKGELLSPKRMGDATARRVFGDHGLDLAEELDLEQFKRWYAYHLDGGKDADDGETVGTVERVLDEDEGEWTAGGLATRALAGVDLDEAFERLSRWADARGRVSRGAFGAALADLAHAGDGPRARGAGARVFDALDADGDGTIDFAELGAGLGALRRRPREQGAVDVPLFDLDGDGTIARGDGALPPRVFRRQGRHAAERVGASPEALAEATAAAAFQDCDLDGDGKLDYAEFRRWYHGQQGWAAVDFDALVTEKDAVDAAGDAALRAVLDGLDAFDADHDGVVDAAELAAGLGALCGGSRVDKIRLTFDLFDRDRDGYLDEFEIRAYLASVYKVSAHDLVNNDTGEPVSADELAAATAAAILEEADSDGDGRVSFDEFARWVSSEHVEELPGDEEETEDDDSYYDDDDDDDDDDGPPVARARCAAAAGIEAAFALYDVAKGTVSFDELRLYLLSIYRVLMACSNDLHGKMAKAGGPEQLAHATAKQCFADCNFRSDAKIDCAAFKNFIIQGIARPYELP